MAKPTVKDVKELAKAREDFILKKEAQLGRSLTLLEKTLLDNIFSDFLKLFQDDKGILKYQGSMMTVNRALDEIFNQFYHNQYLHLVQNMVTDLATVSLLNSKYYGLFTSGKDQTTAIKAQVDEAMKNRIGLSSDSKLVSGGFLDTFVRDNTLRDYLKKYTFKAVTGGAPYKDFVKGLGVIVRGAPDQDSMLAKHFKTFAFDTFSQFDRSTGNQWRQKLNLRAALYSGGIIDASRNFCIEKNDKVFTIEEMEAWKDDPKLPRTKEEREVGYTIGYIGYIDCGRWRCRHQVNWISKQLAIHLRPALKTYFAAE
jgi:hypothetical protein